MLVKKEFDVMTGKTKHMLKFDVNKISQAAAQKKTPKDFGKDRRV